MSVEEGTTVPLPSRLEQTRRMVLGKPPKELEVGHMDLAQLLFDRYWTMSSGRSAMDLG